MRDTTRPPRGPKPIRAALAEFLRAESASGVVLLIATVAALTWANVATSGYHDLWSHRLTLPFTDSSETLQGWVNDALMVVFFFVVGLEIKRELVVGELRDRRAAMLPVVAAVGGMVVPAALFLAVNAGSHTLERGWAIPVATDIAFVVGVLALLGPRVPSGLKLFLLTLAIADDIGGIVIIAVVYSHRVELAWIGLALVAVGTVVLIRKAGVSTPWAYLLPAAVLWFATYESGVHPTIAGVVLGLLTPAVPVKGRAVLEDLEHRLHPWSSFVVVPLFALANAGVVLSGGAIGDAGSSTLAWGVVAGLVLGKPIGIGVATWLAVRTGVGRLPAGVRAIHIVGGGILGGIGFTIALFIAELSYSGRAKVDVAKIGVLAASLAAAVIGSAVLLIGARVGPTPTAD
ncbi:MAG: Na+/H+ antiporter NhaA [Actinomycetia bacterium]|nr:Na+/H+ antiporter NhaA [Actinomycetes bacterium]